MIEGDRRAAAGTADTGQGTTGRPEPSATARSPQPRKWVRVLVAFIERGPRGWNRFEAARELRDHVLPTTVSQLERRGIKIVRRDETVPGAFGPIRCCRYWLAEDSVPRARDLLQEPIP
jgi:hypothetical protein